MTSKRIAQTNQQQKSETSEASGILQRAAVRSVSDAEVQSTDDLEVQPLLSNSAFSKDFSRVPISTTRPQPIQAKLTIGEPGDKYEQEADRVASQVVQQINTPSVAQSTQGKSRQRQDAEEEEIQTKPSISVLQRSSLLTQVQLEAIPGDQELQAKSILHGRDARGAGEASTDVESGINRARGGGQPLDAGLQQSIGQAMGADFSGVKVHTDTQADQLNQSIQARAFTTGQDVFFRQGEYNPGSRGGQELIAHELTHVVQQNGQSVRRSPAIQRQPSENAAPEYDGELGSNPTLYFQIDAHGNYKYKVKTGNPGNEWFRVEQFCSYLATHWLTSGHESGGLRFTDLSTNDRQKAVNALIKWSSSGGLKAQQTYAKEQINGTAKEKNTVQKEIKSNKYSKDTRIWFGTDLHAEAAVVIKSGVYRVYDPNTGKTQKMSSQEFLGYVSTRNAFVVEEKPSSTETESCCTII
ncbi:MAG: DUF4157 domain-containing protein [Nostoc sp.]|uniref:eCIS core domain-containing protein n=1 Tax=Nostoc sp. TaxID=1180 RepID=UPI002FF5D99B